MRLFYLVLSLILLLFCSHIIAQGTAGPSAPARPAPADTIRPGKKGLVTSYLKPGLRQYLLIYQNPKSDRALGFWYWLRDIHKETRQGKDVFIITQNWYGSDSNAYRTVYSINTAEDFIPLYHKELVRGKLSAFDWKPSEIKAADSVAGIANKDFSIALAEPTYNWNLDIETFEMLPLAEGRSFVINFYDAGISAPKYVRYEVSGSEKIGLPEGQLTDCWKLSSTDTTKGTTYSETYWISKKDHQFLKEEDHFNGMIRYKIKVTPGMPDLRLNFAR